MEITLRNLLLEVSERDDDSWLRLQSIVERVFRYRLLKPVYAGAPYITCQYLKGIPEGRGYGGYPPLDVSTAGSGFHQLLLILAFLFARPSSLILLDEPDAHLHVVLQKELYDQLLSLCRERNGQLVVATHSEVLIDNTSPQNILSFYREPHPLSSEPERSQIREALKRVTALDLLLAEDACGVLYLEGTTDFDLLKAWAKVLNHPLDAWFTTMPFWQNNQGRNPKEARAHFFALKSVRDKLKGILLLDGDNRNMPDRDLSGENFTILRWERYEAESYLLHPGALERFIGQFVGELLAKPAIDYLIDQMPPVFFQNPLENSGFLRAEPAGKTLLPVILEKASLHIGKGEYFLIAEQMLPEELPPELSAKLDAIAEILL